jgi:ParB-like chromosome segregation protein Spo0J
VTGADAVKFHPLADIFPLMEGAEFDELVADIKANELSAPIVTYEGMILDGRNRYRACIAAGVKPDLIKGDEWVGDPAAYVISANIHRRHLTAKQKGELIAKLIKAAPEKSNRQIAKAAGVSHTHVNKVRAEMEEAGDVETVSTSVDTKGRKQPAHKQVEVTDDDEGIDIEDWNKASRDADAQHKAWLKATKPERDAKKKKEAERREMFAIEAERLASKLIELDRDTARRVHDFLLKDADAFRLICALARGLGLDDDGEESSS